MSKVIGETICKVLETHPYYQSMKEWPFLYYRRTIRLDELGELNFWSSDSSSNKFSSIKTGNRRIIRLNT